MLLIDDCKESLEESRHALEYINICDWMEDLNPLNQHHEHLIILCIIQFSTNQLQQCIQIERIVPKIMSLSYKYKCLLNEASIDHIFK